MSARLYFRLPLCLTLVVMGGFGCAELPQGSDSDDMRILKELPELKASSLVRMELSTAHDALPEIGYRTLLADGEVVELGVSQGTQALRGRLRRLLLASVEYRKDSIGEAEVVVQKIRLNREFLPMRILRDGLRTVLPFRMSGEAEIEFAQLVWPHGSPSHARFTLMDVPHDVESVLRLPENTVVTLPVDANLALDVGGNFFSRTAGRSPELHRYLNTSVFGFTSAVRRGSLLASGHFRLQVIRGEGEQVRLRILSGGSHTLRGRLGSSSSARANYTFVPATELDRIRAFKRRLDRLEDRVTWVRDSDDRLAQLRDNAPSQIQAVFDAYPGPSRVHRARWEDRARSTVDTALARAQTLTAKIEDLDRRFGARVDAHFDAVENVWSDRIEPVVQRIRDLSSRSYAVHLGVDLSDELTRDLVLLADYEFDLSDAEAAIAFDRAISGRTILQGAQESLRFWGTGQMTFADFTLADTLANDYQGMENPPVKRIATGGSDRRQRRYSVSVQGLGMSVGFEGWFQSNRVELTDEEGQMSEWLNRAWERGQHTRVFGNARAESFGSGAFTEAIDADLTQGGYWFRWKKEYGKNALTPVSDAYVHAANDLGPLALELGFGQQYDGEYPGKVQADLLVVFHGDALDRLFDKTQTTDELLWSVLRDMMPRYRRPVSLPYAHAPIRPEEARRIDYIRDGCEAVAERLGGRYCYSFIDRIFPALKRAQDSGDAADRLAFFESFYRVRAGGSVLSTRFLVRYLAELLHALDVNEGMAIEFKITNANDDSASASPMFRIGDPKTLALGDVTVLEGLINP